jgi:hypothetical protein
MSDKIDGYASEVELNSELEKMWNRFKPLAQSFGDTTKTKIMTELAEIRKNTEEVKFSFSALWSGLGQALAERKTKKK